MDSIYQFPASPTRPLSQITSDRINRLSGSRSSPNGGSYSTPNLGDLTPSKNAVVDRTTPKKLLVDTTAPRKVFGETTTPKKLFVDTANLKDDPFTKPSSSPTGKALPDLPPSHSRTISDVQHMVARFNNLDIKDHAEMRKRDAAALKRALVGREEAESDARKMKQKFAELKEELEAMREFKQETKTLRKDLDEAKERERKVMKRFDVMMEELHRAKETQAHSQNLYEKEIRKARKEAFKSSSALVKMQEELKASRNSLRVARVDLDLAKAKATEKEQEAFTSQFQVVGIQEELNAIKEKYRILEEEKDALKESLKDEEVARIAAEGRIALPPALEDDDEFSSPKIVREASPVRVTPWKHSRKPSSEIDDLRRELGNEKNRRESAEDQIEFMKMECQFQCCSCRIAEKQGTTFTHERAIEKSIASIRQSILRKSLSPKPERSPRLEDDSPTKSALKSSPTAIIIHNDNYPETLPTVHENKSAEEEAIEESSPTYQQMDVLETSKEADQMSQAQDQDQNFLSASSSSSLSEEPELVCLHVEEASPTQDANEQQMTEEMYPEVNDENRMEINDDAEPELIGSNFKTVTTTITIPLVDSSSPNYKSFFSPSTPLTREQAIEQLRIRRGRARSIAGTPKKPVVADAAITPRRDISAPEARQKKTPKAPVVKTGSMSRR